MAAPQTLDPRVLLDPKAARKQASATRERPAANSFQLNSPLTTSHGPSEPTSNGHVNGSAPPNDFGSFYERMHNVERRHDHAPKRRKLDEPSNADDVDDPTKVTHSDPHTRGSGPGDIGEFFQEKKREAQQQQGPTNVVDLTEDKDDKQDDELVVLRDNQDREVCIGTIDGAKVNAHRIPSMGKNFAGSQKVWPAQKVMLTRRPGSATQIIGVVDVTNRDFGTIDVRTAQALAPLLDSHKINGVRVHARLDMRPRKPWEMPDQSISELLKISLTIYCPVCYVKGLGRVFSQAQLYLRTPTGVPQGIEVMNPHEPTDCTPKRKTLAATTSRYTGSTQIQRTQEEVRQEVFRIFDQLKRSDDLPQMDQPELIKTSMLAHQRQALYFMTEREKDKRNDLEAEDESSLWQKQEDRGRTSWYHVITGIETNQEPDPVLGGILADVMGLGKTLNVLSLICQTRSEAAKFSQDTPPKASFDDERTDLRFNSRATLLICPLSVVSNWEGQIKQHIRNAGANFTYVIYHGPNRAKDPEDLTDYDMVITSYHTVASDAKCSQNRPRDVLGELHWFRIVLDEGHVIRGSSTSQSKTVCALSAQRRWAVTGTPVQNRLEDLGALMKFLRIRPFDEPRNFAQYIIAPFKTADTEILPKLRLLVDSITLRRLKDKIDLPKREEIVERLVMNDQERDFYNFYAHEATKDLSAMVKQRETIGGKTYAHVLKAIMRLRLLCAGGSDLLNDEDWDAAQGFSANTAIDLEEINAKPDRTKRQAFELYKMMKDANMNSCARCSRIITHKEVQEYDTDDGDSEDEEDFTFGYLAQCNQLICTDCYEPFKQECLSVAGPDKHGHCPLCESYTKVAFFPLTQHEFDADEAALREIHKNPKLARKAGRYSGPSAKTRALIHALQCDLAASEELMKKGEPPLKTAIFSGWTSHLDLIQLALANSKTFYVRLDGSMRRKQRTEVLNEFSTNPAVTCILVSIGAGGLGLNLTAASRVFVMEPQFNPAAENQAIERVHRLGQKREVIITKYIMENSFEEKMLKLQQRKTELANISMNRDTGLDKQEKAKQKMENLRMLFK